MPLYVPKAPDRPQARPAGPYWLQLGAFGVARNAVRLREDVAGEAAIAEHEVALEQAGRLTLVTVRGFPDLATAQGPLRRATGKGVRVPGAGCRAHTLL